MCFHVRENGKFIIVEQQRIVQLKKQIVRGRSERIILESYIKKKELYLSSKVYSLWVAERIYK
jgi:hypothetical protein